MPPKKSPLSPLTAPLLILTILLALLTTTQTHAQSKWEPNIQKFEAKDKQNPPAPGGILFVGSSSIVYWDTDKAFPRHNIINRGFGGSQTSDSLEFADRIIINYKPRLIAIYAGDNDIAAGKSVETVVSDTMQLFTKIHKALPQTRIIYIAIKPSILRWKLVDQMRQANAQIRAITDTDWRMKFLDIDTPSLGPDGKPRPELFVKDGLHLSPEGYALWNKKIAPLLTKDTQPPHK